jgi:hypothetical protein
MIEITKTIVEGESVTIHYRINNDTNRSVQLNINDNDKINVHFGGTANKKLEVDFQYFNGINLVLK